MALHAFYCVADSKHFLGAVALLNSLRLMGHREPFVLLDCGLGAEERDLLEPHASIVTAPNVRSPLLAKWAAPLLRPAEVMVLVDADVIAVAPLTPLIDAAGEGKVVAFADKRHDRFHPAWAEALGVGQLEPRTYVNAGFLALPRSPGESALERIRDLENSLDLSSSRGIGPGGTRADPFFFPDQDVWNAVLAAFVDSRRMQVLERQLAPAPQFNGVRLVDATTLECRCEDGRRPYLLHHWGQKPWLAPTLHNLYTKLLPRLLLAEDVQVRLAPGELPLRLRPGLPSQADRLLTRLRYLSRQGFRRVRKTT